MIVVDLVVTLLAVAAVAYLVYALVKPEKL
ncbi:MAG TPA: potassium-transporting ATPase subunit F [Microbacteriaceae bacterium]|nr:potassium-transporting ATPase subunit F [Microbacteriaceae bacterium]